MPTTPVESLFRSLREGRLVPVYYFHGAEDVLKDEAIRVILDRTLDPGLRDFNFDQPSAATLDPEALVTLCSTLPMMAERRVVLLRDLEAWKRRGKARGVLLDYLEHPASECVLILLQGSGEETEDPELARRACSVRFEPLSSSQALKWLHRRAAALNLQLEPEAAEHLLRVVGTDLAAISSELHKLSALPLDAPLSARQVGEVVGVRHGETIFDWRDAVMDQDPPRALALLPPVLAQPKVSGVGMVSLLGTTLVGTGLARREFERSLRGRALEEAIFKLLLRNRPMGLLTYREEAPRWARWAAGWPVSRVSAGLRAALAADRALKAAAIRDELGVLTDLVLQLAVDKAEKAEKAVEKADRAERAERAGSSR